MIGQMAHQISWSLCTQRQFSSIVSERETFLPCLFVWPVVSACRIRMKHKRSCLCDPTYLHPSKVTPLVSSLAFGVRGAVTQHASRICIFQLWYRACSSPRLLWVATVAWQRTGRFARPSRPHLPKSGDDELSLHFQRQSAVLGLLHFIFHIEPLHISARRPLSVATGRRTTLHFCRRQRRRRRRTRFTFTFTCCPVKSMAPRITCKSRD